MSPLLAIPCCFPACLGWLLDIEQQFGMHSSTSTSLVYHSMVPAADVVLDWWTSTNKELSHSLESSVITFAMLNIHDHTFFSLLAFERDNDVSWRFTVSGQN